MSKKTITSGKKIVFNPELYSFDEQSNPKWLMFKKIAIMTITFNRLEYTQKFIDSLYSKTHLPFTLYIFDQASTDGTIEYLNELARMKQNVVIKKFKKNIGKARALLYSQKRLQGDLLVYFDNDIEFLSNYWLVHLLKAYYGYFLATSNTNIALGGRAVNQEEYGFRFTKEVEQFHIKTQENSLPRTSYSMYQHHADQNIILDECICIGYTDHLWGGMWAIPLDNFAQIEWENCYPLGIGGVDSFSSLECKRLGVELGYIQNGPIIKHNDWPYTEEKAQLFSKLINERAVTDFHFLRIRLLEKLRKLCK